MKYAILIGDGMADYPIPELGFKSILEAANTENMDKLCTIGQEGLTRNIPDHLPAGSDVAALSLMGYDPEKYYTGRGPLEAANMGVLLEGEENAFRCNLVYIENGIMTDYSAGHITTEDANVLIEYLQGKMGSDKVRFYPGMSYRHLTVIKGGFDSLKTTPPHDITNQKIGSHLPAGKGQEFIQELMFNSVPLLEKHLVNTRRANAGKKPGNMIWLWGQGRRPQLPTFQSKFNLTGSVISAVNLIKGLGRYAGLNVIDVPGATGYIDTNYRGKAEYALRSLEKNDFVFVHVEAPDEAGHNGDIEMKKKAVEDFDFEVVGRIAEGIKKFSDYRILVLPDHPTPVSLRTHTREAVPFVVAGSDIEPSGVGKFDELTVKQSKNIYNQGYKLIEKFLSKEKFVI
ncbi:MAG: cofactor-independent phosphoglycerate mutase [bacterium]|nr:cofactor-independent phosphoglycerate mutase [bacterium]MDD5353715.1 cofactor-independent phosphoglycerate mutase [bacterium]MDD5755683.1 cofactor-independent phosphoglycerate mutase [bacterium]